MARYGRIASLVVLALALGSLAIAEKKGDHWEGRPDFTPGEAKGYFVWKDTDGWHVRWTTKGEKHVFSGSIRCDGKFVDFKAVGPEGRDFIKRVSPDTLEFDARASGGADGADFRVSPATRIVTFDLRIDGAPASPQVIKIGSGKSHPDRVPFTLDRGPKRK